MKTIDHTPPMRTNVLEKPVLRLIDRRTYLTHEEVSSRVEANLAWRGWGRVTNRWLGIVQGTGELFPIRTFVVYPAPLWVQIDLNYRDGGWGLGTILLNETMTHTIDRKYTIKEVFNQLEAYYLRGGGVPPTIDRKYTIKEAFDQLEGYYLRGGGVPPCSFQTSACYHEDRSPYDDLYGFEKTVLERFSKELETNDTPHKIFWNLEAVLLDDRVNERFVNAVQVNGATAGVFDALEMTIGANNIPVYIVNREIDECHAVHKRSYDHTSYDLEEAIKILCGKDMRRLTRADIVRALRPAAVYN